MVYLVDVIVAGDKEQPVDGCPDPTRQSTEQLLTLIVVRRIDIILRVRILGGDGVVPVAATSQHYDAKRRTVECNVCSIECGPKVLISNWVLYPILTNSRH